MMSPNVASCNNANCGCGNRAGGQQQHQACGQQQKHQPSRHSLPPAPLLSPIVSDNQCNCGSPNCGANQQLPMGGPPSHSNNVSNSLLMKSSPYGNTPTNSGCNCGNPSCADAAAAGAAPTINAFVPPGAAAASSSFHQSGSPCLGGSEIQCSTVSSQQMSPRPCSRGTVVTNAANNHSLISMSHSNMRLPFGFQITSM